jgi:arylsulfatase A-like enzyme
MNILYLDIDSLRPDHLSCYGYHRNTSPSIDTLASQGVRFNQCYTSDAPCLPSRTAITTGRFGIRTGVVNHGGIASQPYVWGADRGFSCNLTASNWVNRFQLAGYHTVAFSPFAQRHGAWHWYAGFMEMHNTGGAGLEVASDIAPQVCNWLEHKNESAQPFFMWVNLWDPHTPYRTPSSFSNPFAQDPLPAWYSESVRANHWQKAGPHSPQEVNGFAPAPEWMYENPQINHRFPSICDLQPQQIRNMEDARKMFDGYDMGVAYADWAVGKIIEKLKDAGIYDDTAIIVSSDHGENLGELWVYGDHQTADQFTHRVPLIVRWPGITDSYAGSADDRLIYSIDAAASVLEWSGLTVAADWDGQSFAGAYMQGCSLNQREHLVLSQLAWCAQRSARWQNFICIETYHDGFHDYPRHMIFDLTADPHEQYNLACERPDLLAKGKSILHEWRESILQTSRHTIDPLDTVMSEGGPWHVRDEGPAYIKRLETTGRVNLARQFANRNQHYALG